MTLEKMLHALIASSLAVAGTVKATRPGPALTPRPAPASPEEMDSYRCAKSVASLVRSDSQIGPIFSVQNLVFTSLEASDGTRLLLADAGAGVYSVRLNGEGVNRIRFEIPSGAAETPTTYYLSYVHSETMRSRFFEFGQGHPPVGRDELDYVLMNAHRDQALEAHLNYALHETAESAYGAITDGRLLSGQLSPHPMTGCEGIFRQGGSLAQNLKYNLDKLDLLVNGAGRAPASEMSAPARVVAIPTAANPGSVPFAGVKD